jgi:hypothetical protein
LLQVVVALLLEQSTALVAQAAVAQVGRLEHLQHLLLLMQ